LSEFLAHPPRAFNATAIQIQFPRRLDSPAGGAIIACVPALEKLLDQVSGFIRGYPLLILLFGTHLYLAVRLRFPQRYFWEARDE